MDRPLQIRNTSIIQQLHAQLQNNIPIIACGGIMDVDSAREKLAAGAVLLTNLHGIDLPRPATHTSTGLDHCDAPISHP